MFIIFQSNSNQLISSQSTSASPTQPFGTGQSSAAALNPSNSAVNPTFKYEPNDISNILRAALRCRPDVVILESAVMDIDAQGYRLSDIVGAYFTNERILFSCQQKRMLILPILESGVWTGVRLNLIGDKIVSGVFYKSAKSGLDMLLMDYLASDLKKGELMSAELYFEPAKYYLEQCDKDSNAAFLIENICCDVQNTRHPNVASLGNKIRTIHLNLLRQYMPAFYADFNSRQLGIIPVPSPVSSITSASSTASRLPPSSVTFQYAAASSASLEQKKREEDAVAGSFLNF